MRESGASKVGLLGGVAAVAVLAVLGWWLLASKTAEEAAPAPPVTPTSATASKPEGGGGAAAEKPGPAATGTLAGLVTGGGKPLAAHVGFVTGPDPGEGPGTTTKDGRFELADVPAATKGALVVTANGWRTLTRKDVEVADGKTLDVGTLVLEKALLLRGRVHDPTGKPLAGAEVRALAPPEGFAKLDLRDLMEEVFSPPKALDRATTKEDGTFVLESLGPGSYVVVASHPLFAPSRRDDILLDPAGEAPPVEIYLLPGHRLTVKVLDGTGAGIPGALVSVLSPRMRMPNDPDRALATTDAKGEAALQGLAAGQRMIAARLPGRAASMREAIVPRDAMVELRLGGSAGLVVRVKDEAGAPVEGAEVLAMLDGQGSGGAFTGRTGADGVSQWNDLPAGRIGILAARKEGFAPTTDGNLMTGGSRTELKDGKTVEKDFVLRKGAALVGTVRVRPEGRPVPGAVVTFLAPALLLLGGARSAVADGEGNYRFEGVSPGNAMIAARSEGAASPGGANAMQVMFGGGGGDSESTVQVPEGVPEVRKDVFVDATGSVNGRVSGPDGNPVPGARVAVQPRRGGGGMRGGPPGMEDPLGVEPRPALSAPDGTFMVTGVGAGQELVAAAEAEGLLGASSAPFTLGTGGEVNGVEVKLGAGGTLSGRVADRGGAPLAGAMVRAIVKQGWMRAGSVGEWQFREGMPAFSDAEGKFILKGAPVGALLVRAEAPGFVPGIREDLSAVEGNTTVADFTLSPGLSIAGTVRDDEGKPVAGVRVFARASAPAGGGPMMGGPSATATTDSTGAFRIADLAEGVYDLEVNSPVHAQETVRGVTTGEAALAVALRRATSIRGKVTDEGGAPVKGTGVQAQGEGGSGTSGWGRSGDDGSFEVPRLAPGAYTLRVFADGFQPLTVTGVSGDAIDVNLVLKRALPFGGKVLDSDGKPYAKRFTVEVLKDGNLLPVRAGVTRGSSDFHGTGLGEGRYTLRIRLQEEGTPESRPSCDFPFTAGDEAIQARLPEQ